MAGQDSHFTRDADGQAHMVDVAAKDVTKRVARAGGRIAMLPETLARIRDGSASKGDVLGVARIAAIQAAKRTSELIPLAHPLPLTRVAVDFQVDEAESAIVISVTAETLDRTGVEMEALTGACDRVAHYLRHVQGTRSRHAHRKRAAARKIRREIGRLRRLVVPVSVTSASKSVSSQQFHMLPSSSRLIGSAAAR